MEDYLAAEPLIIDRLKQQSPLLGGKVYASSELENLESKKSSSLIPSAHVLYEGYTVSQSKGGEGVHQETQQQWEIILVVQNANQGFGHQTVAQNDAGPLMAEVMKALQGWKPSQEHGALILSASTYTTTYGKGVIYYPVAFTTKVRLKGLADEER